MRLLSRQHTTRTTRAVAATVAAGAVGLSAALLGASPAFAADPAAPGPNTIIFKGGCYLAGVLYSNSKPSVNNKDDTEAMTVAAKTPLTIVNSLGSAATLTVNGQQFQLPAGQYTSYTPQAGPVTMGMSPACGLNALGYQDYKNVTVTVTPAAAQSPTGNGTGQTGSGTGTGTTGNGSQSGTQNGAKSGAQQPPATSPNGGSKVPQLPAIHGPVARGAVPSAAADPNKDAGTSGGDTSSTTAPAGGKVKLADPRPLSNVNPTGTTSLLALIAAVCLVGVGVAAFRTVFGNRQAARTAASA